MGTSVDGVRAGEGGDTRGPSLPPTPAEEGLLALGPLPPEAPVQERSWRAGRVPAVSALLRASCQTPSGSGGGSRGRQLLSQRWKGT